jgi:hypothetical protein
LNHIYKNIDDAIELWDVMLDDNKVYTVVDERKTGPAALFFEIEEKDNDYRDVLRVFLDKEEANSYKLYIKESYSVDLILARASIGYIYSVLTSFNKKDLLGDNFWCNLSTVDLDGKFYINGSKRFRRQIKGIAKETRRKLYF